MAAAGARVKRGLDELALIEYPLEGGGTVLVEVSDDGPGQGGLTKATGDGNGVSRAPQTFQAALETIQPAAKAVLDAMKSLAPNKVEVAFGLKFTLRSGVPFFSAGTDANINVTVSWDAKADS